MKKNCSIKKDFCKKCPGLVIKINLIKETDSRKSHRYTLCHQEEISMFLN